MSRLLRAVGSGFTGLAAWITAHAQIGFHARNNFIPSGATEPAYVRDPFGLPLAVSNGRVQIINSADGSTLSPGGEGGASLTLPGLFFLSNIAVPGAQPLESAHILIRAWDVSSGPTWSQATLRSDDLLGGTVTVRNLYYLNAGAPPTTLMHDSDFRGLQLVSIPEPTMFGLAIFGLVAAYGVHTTRNRNEHGCRVSGLMQSNSQSV